jgi:hypothetical protein
MTAPERCRTCAHLATAARQGIGVATSHRPAWCGRLERAVRLAIGTCMAQGLQVVLRRKR